MTTFTRRTVLISAFAAFLTFGGSARALDEDRAMSFITDVVERLITLIQADQSVANKQAAFRMLLEDTAAMPEIARYALGRPWRELSDAERVEYDDLFATYISRNYVQRFDDYAGENVQVTSAVDEGQKGVFVDSEVRRPGAEPLTVEWRVIERDGRPQIVDIYVEGVSLLVTQREEFNSLMDRNGGDVRKFISELRTLVNG